MDTDSLRVLIQDDPLFAAEGMDIESVSAVLDDIETKAAELEAVFAGGSWMRRLFFIRYPIARYALPVPFLRSFIACERARRAYLREPSRTGADDILSSWEKAAHLYARDVDRYRALHRMLFRLEVHAGTFVLQDLFGHVSDTASIERTLDALSRNAGALEAEVRTRKGLFENGQSAEIELPAEESWALEPGTMTPEQERLHRLEISSGVSPFRQTEIKETFGPFRYTLSNFDGVPTPHTFMLYVLRDRKTGMKSMWLALVDRFLFTKVWDPKTKPAATTGYTDFVFSGGLSREEMPYWYEPATHLYTVRDQRYWMEIATRIDLVRRPELNADLVRAQKSSMFDLALSACALDLGWYVRHTKRRARQGGLAAYSSLYGLLMRSYPSLYYLTFNRSVWRLDESPNFLGQYRPPAGGSPYRLESEVLAELTPDMLKNVMSAQKTREERERAAGWVS